MGHGKKRGSILLILVLLLLLYGCGVGKKLYILTSSELMEKRTISNSVILDSDDGEYYWSAFNFTSSGDIVVVNVKEELLGFLVIDQKGNIIESVELQGLIDRIKTRDVEGGFDELFPDWVYYDDNAGIIYMSATTSASIYDDYYRIFKFDIANQEATATDNIIKPHKWWSPLYFGVLPSGEILYPTITDEGDFVVWKFNYDTEKQEVYINAADSIISSPTFDKIYYEKSGEKDKGFVVDLETGEEYVVKECHANNFSMISFTSKGNYICRLYRVASLIQISGDLPVVTLLDYKHDKAKRVYKGSKVSICGALIAE